MYSISAFLLAAALLILIYAVLRIGSYKKELERRNRALNTANERLCVEIKDRQVAIERRASELEQANERMTLETSEKQEAQHALKESEERYALVASAANDGIWDWNLFSGEMYYSPRWKSMFGYMEYEIGTKPEEWFSRVHQEDLPKLKSALDAHLRGETECFECEYRLRNQSGYYQWMHARGLAVRDGEGRAIRMAGSQADTTVRKETEEQLMYNAFHDGLTGLPNRMLFMEHLQKAVARRKRVKEYHFAVLFLDIDKFKNINDSFGHMIGDELLESVAGRLQPMFRSSDTFARLGGDEFALLLDDIKHTDYASQVADRIHRKLAGPFILKGAEVFVTTSIGIALSDFEYEQPDDMMRDADIAMHRAKLSGRACYMLFDKDMHTSLLARLQLETDLHMALKNREFSIAYQPIYLIKSGQLRGFEALLRWDHPKKGLLPPGDFIPLAEETGLINAIGEWVLYEGAMQMKRWHERFPANPPLGISINVSGRQFLNQKFIKLVKDVLDETRLDPESLILELTESHLLADSAIISSKLKDLKSLKVHIHIDDFGTGYSSLAYLEQFPISALKIDRSFTEKIVDGRERSGIIEAILGLARNLDLEVIAEGVEREEQVSVLKNLNCQYAQGFYYSPAVSPHDAEKLIEMGVSPARPLVGLK